MDLAIISGNMVRDAVVRRLRGLVGGEVPIYVEQVVQDFEVPCIFVYESSMYEERDVTPVFWQFRKIEVKFYPSGDSSHQYSDCHSMGERIRRALCSIDVEHLESGETVSSRAIRPECRLFEDYFVYYATYRLKCRLREADSAVMAQRHDSFHLL